LRPLVVTARAVLDDLDENDVPARLTRVARSSARRLPPPFEQSLIDSVVKDEDFRALVVKRWTDDGRSDPVVDAFLDDPASAEALLADASESARLKRDETEEESSAARVGQLEAELATAKQRLVALRATNEQRLREARAADKRAREGLESSLDEARVRASKADDAATRAESRVRELEARVDELEALDRRLTQRETRRREAPGDNSPRSIIPGNDPSQIAVWLDAVERILRPYRESFHGSDAVPRGEGLDLPPGIAPDGGDAIDALRTMAIDRIVVDGYNVASALGVEEFSSAEGREAVLRLAHRLIRLVDAQVTVVFDAVGIKGRRSYVTETGVVVRFPPDRSADDEIVDLVIHSETRTVVITNDRELRERCGGQEVLVLWSGALVAWSKT
jgi:hypothetical protein